MAERKRRSGPGRPLMPKPRPVRDRFGGLCCQVQGCRSTIQAPTGMQELLRLMAHYHRAHLAAITMQEALEIRSSWETRATP